MRSCGASVVGVGEVTSRSMPPARMRPVPLAIAWRYQGRSGPPAERTYRSSPTRTTHIVMYGRRRAVGRAARRARSSVASPMRASSSSVQSVIRRADPDERLDGAAFVHRRVGVGDAVEVGLVVEDEAGVDGAVEDVVEQLGDVDAGRVRGRRASRRCGRTSG